MRSLALDGSGRFVERETDPDASPLGYPRGTRRWMVLAQYYRRENVVPARLAVLALTREEADARAVAWMVGKGLDRPQVRVVRPYMRPLRRGLAEVAWI